MSTESQPTYDPSVLTWMETAIRRRLLAYVLGCDRDSIDDMTTGKVQPNDKQLKVIRGFSEFQRALPSELDETSKKEAVRSWVTFTDRNQRPVSVQMRELTSGPEPGIDTTDELEAVLAALAIDAYPAFILPPDDTLIRPFGPHLSSRTSVLVLRHDKRDEFCEIALSDTTFKDTFTAEEEHIGRYAMIYANTGRGGSVQLSLLPSLLLQAAWEHMSDNASPQAFATAVVEELNLIRAVLSGKTRAISARFAFAGVLLPPNAHLDLGNGDVVRATTDRDRKYAPEALAGKISHTDSAGKSVVANYDGDVVLEHNFPYRVKVGGTLGDDRDDWFDDPAPHTALRGVATRLRFSLMLAVRREQRVQIVDSWQHFDDPLHPDSVSWNDPRQSTGITPTQLAEEEVVAWGEMYGHLNTPSVNKIEVALTRILRAASERREPSDVLVDSVIAWENLFGTKDGELRFRISASLAVLLADSADQRVTLSREFAKIYDLRSKVVHGSGHLSRDEYPMCQEALDIAVRAVRTLVTDRTDILALPDGGTRSKVLLLGG